jgi:hypothetical protein
MKILVEIAKNLDPEDSAAVKELLRIALSMDINLEYILKKEFIKGMEVEVEHVF